MGTNYYAVYIPTEEDIKELNKLRVKNLFDKVHQNIELWSNEIHLGKRSGGWQFLFDHNNVEYYKPTRSSLEDFLRSGNYLVKNEYGEYFEIDEFFKIVDDWNTDPHNHWTYESYYEEHPSEYVGYFKTPYNIQQMLYNKAGIVIKPEDMDFDSDGLRWSSTTDFC